MEFGEESG